MIPNVLTSLEGNLPQLLSLFLNNYETVAKYVCRKFLLEDFTKLTAKMPESGAVRRWKFVIFVFWPSNFEFCNSFTKLSALK